MPTRTTSTPGVLASARTVRCDTVPVPVSPNASTSAVSSSPCRDASFAGAGAAAAAPGRRAGEADEPAAPERVERPVQEHAEPRLLRDGERAPRPGRAVRVARAELERVHRHLHDLQARPREREDAREVDGVVLRERRD